MITAFEKVPTLDASGQAEAADKLTKELRDSDTVFLAQGDGWITKQNGVTVTVTPDYLHGLYTVSTPTGVVIAQGSEVATRAYANHLSGFVYKISDFWAQAPDGSRSWAAGSEIFLGYSRVIGAEKASAAAKRIAHTASQCVENLGKVNSSPTDLREVEQNRGGSSDIARLLRRLGS